jgi:hypothetical protein
MITPSYSITATERVLPNLAFDFTTASLDSRVTFTRSGNTATVINSSGAITAINADLPRFDYNPTTLVCEGLLIEESRTNLLLNSLIDGTSLGTQSVAVTAVARTLSFYGTGTVVLSGAHSATVIGAGAYPTRTTLTFTSTLGLLTITVTGTVQFAQLELGAFATSFIPTAGLEVTRNADIATMTGTNFSDWFNASEGAFYVLSDGNAPIVGTTAKRYVEVAEGAAITNSISLEYRTTIQARMNITYAGASQALVTVAKTNGGFNEIVGAYKVNNFQIACNGTLGSADTVGDVPINIDTCRIGHRYDASSAAFLNGHMAKLFYWPQSLTAAEVQAFSK